MASTTLSERLIPVKQYTTPSSAGTVTVNSNGYVSLVLNPAGTLATLTVTFPSSPSDLDVVEMSCSQIVTTLTMNGGTINGALVSLAVGGSGRWRYNSDASTWFKF